MIAKQDYLAATPYTAPVEFKKLGYIYEAIEEQARLRGTSINELRILEVACGEGGITLPMASLGCPVRAFDLDSGAAELTQQRGVEKGFSNLTVTTDNGFTFYDGTQYDLVIVSEVINQVSEPDRFIENIARSMKEEALLIVTLPNGYGPWQVKNRVDPRNWLRKSNLLRAALGKRTYHSSRGVDSCHYFTRRRLVDLFKKHSLHLVNMANSDSFFAMSSITRKNQRIGNLDVKLADALPFWAASGWYFSFRKRGPAE
ncbi:MAG: methyltransferase domain-containing protein [Planctomycetes bacterium]|nr:methyltransferase domain-containing protein [Planctomycetota bacterium]